MKQITATLTVEIRSNGYRGTLTIVESREGEERRRITSHKASSEPSELLEWAQTIAAQERATDLRLINHAGIRIDWSPTA